MDKTSQWAQALNKNTEALKKTISDNEVQSTKEIAEILRTASQERQSTIKRVIAEERKAYDQSVRELFKVKTWQGCVMFIPFVICIGLLTWSTYLHQQIDSQKAQSEYWAKHMGNAEVTTCRWENEPHNHPCVRVVPGRTYGENGDLMVIKGY